MHHPGLTLTAFGLGAALGVLPGPVQFLLLTEASRGGVRRGLGAMAGANGTFGALLLAIAAGVAVAAPGGGALRVLRVAGGAFLLWMAGGAVREARRESGEALLQLRRTPPAVRGILAVLLNPGAWIFLATSASAVLAEGVRLGGKGLALLTALAMLVGVVLVDGTMVLLGGASRRNQRIARIATPVFAAGLAAFGGLLVVQGLHG